MRAVLNLFITFLIYGCLTHNLVAEDLEIKHGVIEKELPYEIIDCSSPNITFECPKLSIDSEGLKHPFEPVFHPELGLGWRDPSGLSWFSSTGKKFVHSDAQEYCDSNGGRLPSKEEFEKLRTYMGGIVLESEKEGEKYSSELYSPQILPLLEDVILWSSEVFQVWNKSEAAWVYVGKSGAIFAVNGTFFNSVRCVIGR